MRGGHLKEVRADYASGQIAAAPFLARVEDSLPMQAECRDTGPGHATMTGMSGRFPLRPDPASPRHRASSPTMQAECRLASSRRHRFPCCLHARPLWQKWTYKITEIDTQGKSRKTARHGDEPYHVLDHKNATRASRTRRRATSSSARSNSRRTGRSAFTPSTTALAIPAKAPAIAAEWRASGVTERDALDWVRALLR